MVNSREVRKFSASAVPRKTAESLSTDRQRFNWTSIFFRFSGETSNRLFSEETSMEWDYELFGLSSTPTRPAFTLRFNEYRYSAK